MFPHPTNPETPSKVSDKSTSYCFTSAPAQTLDRLARGLLLVALLCTDHMDTCSRATTEATVAIRSCGDLQVVCDL